MKKTTLLFVLTWVLAVRTFSQTQQINWYNFIPGSTSTTGVAFNGPPSAKLMPSNNFTNYRGYNAAFDDNGNMLFYVLTFDSQAKIYGSNGTLISNIVLPSSSTDVEKGSKEIPIIKMACGFKYHIIIGSYIYEFDFIASTVLKLITVNGNSLMGSVNYAVGSVKIYNSVIAISTITDSKYNVYYLQANKPGYTGRYIEHKVIDPTNLVLSDVVKSAVDFTLLPGTSATSQFDGYVPVLEVSPTKNYIAFAEDKNILVYNLLNDGKIGSFKGLFEFETLSSTTDYKIAGLEFSADGSKLVFSRFNSLTGSVTSDAVGIINITASSPTISYISNSNDYARSEIELARDGNLYITSSSKLAKINLSSGSITNVLDVNYYVNSETNASSRDYRIRTLPDQIDGINNSAGFGFTLDTYTTTSNGSWANGVGQNPFDVKAGQSIRVKNSITIDHDVTISNMTLEFYNDASFFVTGRGKLTLRSCKIKGFSCGNMWRGIKVWGGGQLVTNDNLTVSAGGVPSGPYTIIEDAKIGIDFTGSSNKIFRLFLTEFNKNGRDISSYGIDGQTSSFTNCWFNHLTPLKNQDISSGGVFQNDAWYGKEGAVISRCDKPTSLVFSKCVFKGGTIGIFINIGRASILDCKFTTMQAIGSIGIKVDQANIIANTELRVTDECEFYDIGKAIQVSRGSKINLEDNVINIAKDNAIELNKNINSDITVTGNSITFCEKNAILLLNNGGNSRAVISSNIINGLGGNKTSVGISITETGTQSASVSFRRNLVVSDNIMKKVSYGIKLNKISGAQDNSITAINQSSVQYNTIEYEATLDGSVSDANSGIQLMQSNGITVFRNNIKQTLKTPKNVINRGVSVEGSGFTLIKENTIGQSGRGVYGTGDCYNSNYVCNTFNQTINGIALEDHYLRNTGKVHGKLSTESRDNTFVGTTSKKDLRLSTTASSMLKVARMTQMIDKNKWVFTSPPTIEYVPNLFKSINAGFGSNPCDSSESAAPPEVVSDYNESADEIPSNPGLTWQWGYQRERELKLQGSSPNNLFMNSLLDIEDFIAMGDDQSALSILMTLTAPDVIGEKYLLVYSIYLNSQLPELRNLNPSEIAELTPLAQLDPNEFGYAVYIARGILNYETGEEFYTGEIYYKPAKVDLAFAECGLNLEENDIVVYIIREDGSKVMELQGEIDLLGHAYIPGYLLEDSDFDLNTRVAFDVILSGQHFISNYYTIVEWIDGTDDEIDLCMSGLVGASTNVLNATHLTNSLTLYPNPTSGGVVNIQGEVSANAKAIFLDITGKNVGNQCVKNNQIDIEALSTGAYIVMIKDESDNTVARLKLMVK